MTLTLIIWAALAGFLGALVGLGGGIILTPVLTIIFGIDIKYAIGASIIAVIATSSGSTTQFVKDKIANLRVGIFLEMFTSFGAVIGALMMGILPANILYIFFSLVLLNSFFGMLKKSGLIRQKKRKKIIENDTLAKKYKLDGSYFDKAEGVEKKYKVEKTKQGALVMLGAGFASGMLGIGSGAFKVVALDNYMKLPIKVSTATSNFMMGVTASASSLIYFFNGMINANIASQVAIGVLIGSKIGAICVQKIKGRYIRLIFLPILLFTIINMFLKGVGIL